MMKDNLIAALLTLCLLLSVLATAFLSYRYVRLIGQQQVLQLQMATANANVTRMNGLASEAIRYGEKNKAIEPVLQAIGARPGQPAAAPAGAQQGTPLKTSPAAVPGKTPAGK